MIPDPVVLAMLRAKALYIESDRMLINFVIVQEQFPRYLEFLVTQQLNDIEKEAYVQGFMHYKILQNGWLKWMPTNKRLL